MKISTFLLAVLFCFTLQNSYAQDTQSFNYQAVVRKASGELIANTDISVKFSIQTLQGALIYAENQDVTTDPYGVINLGVGKGSATSGTFVSVQWEQDLNLKVEVDYDKNGTIDLTGTTLIANVPKAAFAGKAGVAEKAQGLTYELAAVATSGDYNDLKNKPAALAPQTLALDNYNLSISGGNTVSLTPLASYDNQQLSISGSTISISGGNSITLPPGNGSGDMVRTTYDANTNNKVDVAENAEKIGAFPVSTSIPAIGQVLTYNGTAWAPAASGAPADASAGSKGIVQLAGDLGGTATAPTVPALANKVDKTITINSQPLSANVTLTKTEVGLANVDNTSDANKPVSTATQTAIDAEATRATTAEAAKVAKTDAFVGDVTGTYNATKVEKLQGTAVTTTVPTTGEVLTYNGTAWAPAAAGGVPDATTLAKGAVQLAGDLTGTAASPAIATGAVTSAKILDATIATADIAPLAVDATLLAADAVTTAKILDGNVTAAKLADMGATVNQVLTYNGTAWAPAAAGGVPDATTLAKGAVQLAGDLTGTAASPAIAADAVTSAKIFDGTIAVADLANDAVETAKIKDAAVTGAKIAQMGATDQQVLSWDNGLSIWKPVSAGGTPDATALAKGTVQLAGDLAGTGSTAAAPVITDAAVTAPKLATDAVETAKIKDANVTYAKIQNVAASSLIGNGTGSAAAAQEITLGDGLAFDGTTLKAVRNNYIEYTTATYTVTATDYIIMHKYAGTSLVTLPTPGPTNVGRTLIFIEGTGVQTITFDGGIVVGSTQSVGAGLSYMMICDGTNWRILAQ